MTWNLFILTIALAYEASCAPSDERMQGMPVRVDARKKREVSEARLSSMCDLDYDDLLLEYVSDQKTWQAAKSYCMESQVFGINGNLICDTSRQTNDYLDAKTASDTLWIGGSSLSGAWQWVNGESIPTDSGNKSPRWNSGEPNNLGGSQHCMVANYNGHKWDDQNCDGEKSFVCQYEYFEKVSGRVLRYYNKPETYEIAREKCQGIGASLLIADTEEINDYLRGYDVWVAASDGKAGANWVWENGSELSSASESWAVAPDHLCAFYSYDDEGLISRYCLEEHAYVCERRFPSC